MSKRRVVVTGLGMVSPVGSTVDSAWDAVLRGESGIGPITRFDVSAFPVRFGGAVRDFDVAQYISAKEARRMDDFMHYGVAAGMQAITDSRLDFTKTDPTRCAARCAAPASAASAPSRAEYGDYLKAQQPAQDLAVLRARDHHQHDRRASVDPLRPARARTWASSPPAPPPRMPSGLGMRTIQYGDADVIIAGGGEMATTRCGLGSFGQAKALSTRNDAPQEASRPWDQGARRLRAQRWRRRGACSRSSSTPAQRGAHIYAELVGFGMSGDAYHITAPPEDGEGARLAMVNALRDAQPEPERRAVHQRARDLDAAGRQGRDRRHEARLRRSRQARSR